MIISLSSFLMTSLIIVLLIGILRFIIQRVKVLSQFGIVCIYCFSLLILLRGFLPIDFYKISLTHSFYSNKTLPLIQDFINQQIYLNKSFHLSIRQLLSCLWITGSILFILKRLSGFSVLNKALNELDSIENNDVLEIFSEVYNKLLPHRISKFKIIHSDIFGSPAIWGMIKPIIILPTLEYTHIELRFIFWHELLHYKHHDFLIKLIADLLISIHWWNPFIRFSLLPLINQSQELLVDYKINNHLSKQEKIFYLEVLYKSLKYSANQKYDKHYVYSFANIHSCPNISNRFYCIMQNNIKSFSYAGIIFCVFVFLLSYSVVIEPSYKPDYDELGNKIFYMNQNNSYYIWDGINYNLYLDDEYVYSTPDIVNEFKHLPIYHNSKEKNK